MSEIDKLVKPKTEIGLNFDSHLKLQTKVFVVRLWWEYSKQFSKSLDHKIKKWREWRGK